MQQPLATMSQGRTSEVGDEHLADNVKHIALIMDGNRRWAQRGKLSSVAGHRAGVEALKRVIERCGQLRIPFLTVYAFSTENWRRSRGERQVLFGLLRESLQRELPRLHERGIQLSFVGDLSALDGDLQAELRGAAERTSQHENLRLQVALNYGGRREILEATKRIARAVQAGTLEVRDIDEKTFHQHLLTGNDVPDPDLLVRTGGEYRISNYLLWQIAYAEIVVDDTLWPDFKAEDLDRCLGEFQKRSRRFGR